MGALALINFTDGGSDNILKPHSGAVLPEEII